MAGPPREFMMADAANARFYAKLQRAAANERQSIVDQITKANDPAEVHRIVGDSLKLLKSTRTRRRIEQAATARLAALRVAALAAP